MEQLNGWLSWGVDKTNKKQQHLPLLNEAKSKKKKMKNTVEKT